MKRKRAVRVTLAALMVLSSLGLVFGYTVGASGSAFEDNLTKDGLKESTGKVVEPRDGITVVATDSNSWRGKAADGPRARSELVAFAPNGSVLYYNDSHTRHWDVDPVPGTEATVEYMYADHLNASQCPSNPNLDRRNVSQEKWDRYENARETDACTRNGFERVNLTTGEVTPVWSRVTPGKEATRYHDADRINDTHLVVADIYLDRVFVVNTETGQTEWTWNANGDFDPESGGDNPHDWTHINDVEVLPDGRIMVSARNQDRVIFLNRSTGLERNWTLGGEDDYGVLYEQHNPDYIPKKNGGPAALVADSENNRVVEYQRRNGSWERTWLWRDAQMQWPRDADRLPNGHTLISDSNGNRVFEVNQRGEVVWSVNIAFPYEAERLGTGDESSGGPSAAKANLTSHTPGVAESALIGAKQVLPGRYLNGLMYITPVWMGFAEVLELAVLLLSAVALVGVEAVTRYRS